MRSKTGRIGAFGVVLAFALSGCSEKKEDQVNPCYGVTCSDHGLCTAKEGKAHCECYMGYKSEGLDCVEDEDAETAEDMEEEEAEAVAEAEQPEVAPVPAVDAGGVAAVPARVAKEEFNPLFEALEGVRKSVETNIGDCEKAANEALGFYSPRQEKVKEAAGKLRAKALDVEPEARLTEARQLMSALKTSIDELNTMMSLLKRQCPDQARAIGTAMSGARICALNPGDGKTLTCLEPGKW